MREAVPLPSRRCWSLGGICSSRRLTSKSNSGANSRHRFLRDSPTKLGRGGIPPIELLGRAGARTPEQQVRAAATLNCRVAPQDPSWEERTLRHSRYLRAGTLTTTLWASSAVGHAAQRSSPRNSCLHKVRKHIARRMAGVLGPRLPLLLGASALWTDLVFLFETACTAATMKCINGCGHCYQRRRQEISAVSPRRDWQGDK